MGLITNPLFFVLVLVTGFLYYYKRRKSIPAKKPYAFEQKSFVVDEKAFAVGEAFEDYVEEVLFGKYDFDLIDKTHKYAENSHRYIESSKNPDFKFRSKHNGQSFHVEAKYRSKYYNNIIWCKPYQLDRYREIDKHTTVYIAIGIGGSQNAPQHVYVIPVSELHQHTFEPYYFHKYRCPTGCSYRMN